MARSRKLNLKSILKVVVFAALAILLIGGISSCFGDDTDSVSIFKFERGELDSKGEHIESKRAVYSEAFKCKGLKCVPDFDGHITYDVYFYDADKNFISSVTDLKKTYEGDVPFATYARVVIYPEVPEDESEDDYKIPFYEVYSVANKLNITVSEKQSSKYSENLYNADSVIEGTSFTEQGIGEKYSDSMTDAALSKITHAIAVEYNTYDIFIKHGEKRDVWSFGVAATSGDIVTASVHHNALNSNPNEWVKLTLEIPQNSEYGETDHIRVRLPLIAECYIFGYNK